MPTYNEDGSTRSVDNPFEPETGPLDESVSSHPEVEGNASVEDRAHVGPSGRESDLILTDKNPPSSQLSATHISRRLAPGGGGGGAWLGGPKTGSSDKYGNTGKKPFFHVLGSDLFGDEIKADAKGKLRERFDFPPFSVLNAREGPWQERKRAWLSIGIQSEVGRGENLLKMSDTLLEPDPEKRAAMQAARGGLTWNVTDMDAMRHREKAQTFGSGGPGTLGTEFKAKSFNTQDWVQKKVAEGEIDGGMAGNQTGTSIFDPVLTELCYRWFCPPGGLILDPFAGGSVRGIVAGLLGFQYHGIDLRPEQIEANHAQRTLIAPDAPIEWVVGDSNKMLEEAPQADLVFSCPPYGDLEQYSDDPDDLSNMTWNQFVALYLSIIAKACARLKDNRFACFVVGEYRDKKTGLYRGFVPLTCTAFMKEKVALYNEAILITAVGSLPIRVTKQFESTRKLGKTHQNVLIFCKGDPALAARAVAGEELPSSAVAASGPPIAVWAPSAPSLPPGLPRPGPATPSDDSVLAPIPAGGELGPALALGNTPAQILPPTLPRVEVSGRSSGSLAEFLGMATPLRRSDWKAEPPPDLTNVKDLVLNFETNGLNWAGGDEPIGVTVGTLDRKLKRFLPFGFQEGNLPREQVIRFLQDLKDKNITNANTRFEVHMGRAIGVDFEAQGCRVSDIMHTAALLDERRRKFAVDVLAKDYLGGIEVPRVDERNMSQYAANEVATRAEYQVDLVAQLRGVMWPQIVKEDLQEVHHLEDRVIYPVVEMEKNGAPIDMELLEQFGRECTKRHGELMLEISREAGFNFEHSATGWSKLFDYCHLTPSDSYAEHIILAIDHPLIQKAHRAGQLGSLNSKTFAAYKKQIGPDGILRYDINQLRGDDGGTVSGRFSIGYVQQVPNHDNHHMVFGSGDEKLCFGMCDLFPRRLFRPDIGDYLEADAEQIEYRLFAHFAENEEVLRAYREDPRMSFHKKTWAMFKIHKPDMLYSHQKNLNFAKQYGAKLIKLATMMGFITAAEATEIRSTKTWDDPRLKEAKEIEGIFKKVMPEGDYLLDRASHLAKPFCDDYCRKGDKLHQEFSHRGYVKTIMGRRSRFPDNYKTYIALNRVLQGSGADIMKEKMVELHNERKYTGFVMRLTVHDQFGGDATQPETKGRVSELLDRQSFPQLKVPILWAVKTGPSWAECKE